METPEYAHSLGFLLSQVGAQTARLFAERLAPLGISPRAFAVLSHLGHDDGIAQQQLADALSIHRNVMVGLIDQLEEAGWVRRHRGAADRRVFEIRLTAEGREIAARAERVIPGLDDDLAASLSDRQRGQLIAQLERVAQTLGLAGGIHPGLAAPGRPG